MSDFTISEFVITNGLTGVPNERPAVAGLLG
jgi:hypothetical protein